VIFFYTALYGDHIPLLEFDTKGVEFRCYTDRPLVSKTWKIIQRPAVAGSPRMNAKHYKMAVPDAGPNDISVWIDASIRVTDVHEMVKVIKAALKGHDLALFKHPERTSVYDEAVVSMNLPKYAGLPLLKQADTYIAAGLPADAGLWAGGVIARRHHAQRVNFEKEWWAENVEWSYQDQLSLPYVLWKNNIKPGVIPGSVYGTKFHTWTPTPDPEKPFVPAPSAPISASPAFPLLSVVTPTHNPKWLDDCWRSLRDQEYSKFEWLISVNDKSGKRVRVQQLTELVRSIVGNDPRVKILQDLSPFSHVGQRKAFAFGEAAGDVVIEFDHDDILTPNALGEIAKAFADPEVGFVYSDFADFQQGASDLQGNLTYRHPDVRPGWIISGMSFYDETIGGMRPGKYECVRAPEPTALVVSHIYTAPNHVRAWRRSVYEALGGHNPEFPVADDHELICRTYLVTKFRHIAKPLYLYRITGENTWAQNVGNIKEASDRLQNIYLENLVLRECALLGVPAVELGGGIDPRAGWTPCDLQDAPIIADLRQRWPFADGSVGAFRASDLLEHLPDKMHTMAEIHRCLRPGGWLLSMTPSAEGVGAHMDPTHVSYWVAPSFWYYTRDASARYIRNSTMRFREVHLDTVPINIQGLSVPYVRADLVKL
jgi:O-antigen biosynthesis protein